MGKKHASQYVNFGWLLSNITYSLNAQGSMETWKNVIPRYGMLRIAYRFSKKPEKK